MFKKYSNIAALYRLHINYSQSTSSDCSLKNKLVCNEFNVEKSGRADFVAILPVSEWNERTYYNNFYKEYPPKKIMGFLGFGKKKEVVDLSERYRRQQEKLNHLKREVEDVKKSPVDSERPPTYFQSLVNAAQKQNIQQAETEDIVYADLGESIEERRKKLTKRLMEITSRMEDLSNQIYHLTQRIELIERKMNIKG